MNKMKSLLLAGAFALAALTPALAAGIFSTFPPAGGSQFPSTIPITGIETIPADTNLTQGLNPATETITTSQLAGYAGALNGTWRNALTGGNFTSNLWQRGTTSASITTVALYGPDRWWGLSGTGTAFTIIKETGATDITTGFSASARVQRTASQTGVIATCFGQVLTSGNSTQFQGKTAEFSFWAKAGANFSAASSNVTVTIAYGTGANESMANFTTGAWTGYTAAVAQTTTLTTSFSQYSAVAAIPVTATQVGVKICYTPVGTAGANDWFEIGNAQLDANANAVAKSTATDTNYSILAFEYRDSHVEQLLQQAYFYEIDESAVITPIGPCAAIDVTHTNCYLTFPVKMRGTPTMTYTAGFASPTSTTQATLGACSALATAVTVTSATDNPSGVLVTCTATTIPAAGIASFLYSNNGSGKIVASAEL